MSDLARDLEYDREISRAHYEQAQDEEIEEAVESAYAAWVTDTMYDDRFDRLMATRDAAQDIIDACNCALYDKFK